MDDLAPLATRSGVVGEWIGRHGLGAGTVPTTSHATTISSTESSTTTIPTSETSTAAAEASTTGETATTTKAATANAETRSGAGKTVLTNFQRSTLPIIAVELSDGVAGILGVVKGNDSRALGTTIGSDVDVCADDSSLLRCKTSCQQLVDLWGTEGQ